MADVPLMNNPMTTAEDIIVAGGSGAPTALPVGSNGDVLTVTAGVVGWAAPAGGGGGSGNLWTMNKSSSQTLTSNTLTQITFDTTVIDGGSSTIDLANDRFVAPATGFYMVFGTWLWETTAPSATAHMSVKVGSTESIALCRLGAGGSATGGLVGNGALSLTAGDFVTMWLHPGASVTPTARGNASVHLASAFTLVRIT